MRVVSPVSVGTGRAGSLAPRLRDLAGRRLGLVYNSKPGGREVLERLGERMESKSGVLVERLWSKSRSSIPAPFLHEVAAHADAVLNAVGD